MDANTSSVDLNDGFYLGIGMGPGLLAHAEMGVPLTRAHLPNPLAYLGRNPPTNLGIILAVNPVQTSPQAPHSDDPVKMVRDLLAGAGLGYYDAKLPDDDGP